MRATNMGGKSCARAHKSFGSHLRLVSAWLVLPAIAVGVLSTGTVVAQRGGAFGSHALTAPPRDGWRTNGGNLYNQRYSPLTRIDRGNVGELKGVWRTHLN